MWSLRLWYGMGLGVWRNLLAENDFAVTVRRWPMVGLVTAVSTGNSILGRLQNLCFGRTLVKTQLRDDPVFIIGHWRTGTTFLHELLSLDPRLAAPDSYACFCPIHSLLTARLAHACLGPFLPAKRPMDAMPLGWRRPQETEFALCALGLPSPYRTLAFPGNPPRWLDADLERLPPESRLRWENGLLHFFRQITYRASRRLVVKSPADTFRIATLIRLFPQARFIHLVRNPVEIFASTVRMWQSMFEMQALQRPCCPGLEDQVFDTLDQMYQRLERDRGLVRPSHFHDLRYEDLVRNPAEELRRIYERFELGAFGAVAPAIERYLANIKNYCPNHHELSPEIRDRVMHRWQTYAERYGYPLDQSSDREGAK